MKCEIPVEELRERWAGFNPDACPDPNEPHFWACEISDDPLRCAAAIFPKAEVGPAKRAVIQIGWYCAMKRKAMMFRLSGNIPAALRFERECEITYQALPEWARW